ncbi:MULTISPECIES: winged helix-turn-helix domain-containing protein [Catenuloplanes]|uniref:DNA-binding response OmpR family regulator n=1 Tax=Catenuloplanes niger TaxID=587534 RepID=A0AAE4CZK4_9ACTN|nr:winged helix-turn-helix domain-containing protein [Catenuloplanes niger]MDR7326984.1 DNA-binding response OmpR family regulator [Catenuloplanes niger]
MTEIPVTSLTIGIAATPDDRRRLARLLGDTEAFLIVSSVDQARQFLDIVGSPESTVITTLAATATATATMATPPAAAPVVAEQPALRVDSDRRVLRWRDREVSLTPLEHDFLNCLVGSPGQVWTYKQLHLEVWGNEHLGRGSDLHSVVRRVRRKLADIGTSARILSVRGVGFRYASH